MFIFKQITASLMPAWTKGPPVKQKTILQDIVKGILKRRGGKTVLKSGKK